MIYIVAHKGPRLGTDGGPRLRVNMILAAGGMILLAALAVYAALFYVSRAAVTLASGAVRAPRRRRYGEGAQISAVTLWQP